MAQNENTFAIQKPLDIINELHIEFIFLEIDQAIYTKVLDPMFKMGKDLKYSIKLSHVWVNLETV